MKMGARSSSERDLPVSNPARAGVHVGALT
jgi:hypothetical protein